MIFFILFVLGYLPTLHWFLRNERTQYKVLEGFDFVEFGFVSIIWPYWVLHRAAVVGWAKIDPGPIEMKKWADTLFPPIKEVETRQEKKKRIEKEEAERMRAIRQAINQRERELGFPETVDF